MIFATYVLPHSTCEDSLVIHRSLKVWSVVYVMLGFVLVKNINLKGFDLKVSQYEDGILGVQKLLGTYP